MRIVITGATGFVGRAVLQRLARDGHEVHAWVRRPETARWVVGEGATLVDAARGEDGLLEAIEPCDAVLHLGGENVLQGRWTRARKQALIASRVELGELLRRALRRAAPRPRTLVAASAVGFYGPRDDQPVDEDGPSGDDFLSDLCRRWEAAVREPQDANLRVATLRIGLVLGLGGGAFDRLAPLFAAGLGGRLGHGRQAVSWIHLDDLVELIVTALTDPRYRGVFNATAPHPVSNRELTSKLGDAFGRAAPFPAPALALRLALGESAGVLLTGQRVLPRRALALEFRFAYARLEDAFAALVRSLRAVSIRRATAADAAPDAPRSTYILSWSLDLAAPPAAVFGFFERLTNLGLVIPPSWRFDNAADTPARITPGAAITHRVAMGPFRLHWRTEIVAVEPPTRFVDRQVRGPYRVWHHEHTLEAHGSGARIAERLRYTLPLGPLGRLAHACGVRWLLRVLFAYRVEALRRRFGAS